MSSLVSSNSVHLELTNFHIRGVISYNFAEFTLEQQYSNNSRASINAKYVFPIISDIHLSGLKLVKDNMLFKLDVEETYNPLKSYQDAKKEGESAHLLEMLRKSDMMVYDVGDIAANSEVKIEASYVYKSEQTLPENFWKIVFPKTLFPCKLENAPCSAEIMIIEENALRKQQGKVIVKNGNVVTLDKKHFQADFKNFSPENDIEITYYLETPDEPFIIVQQDPRINRHAFYLSYKPDEDLLDSSGVGQVGEFAILLDRSGSMRGRLQLATEAVALFIRSLPENCYFNIINFGSGFDPMFKKSKKYDKCSADEAHRAVLSNDTMGGTNLIEPLKYVLESPRIPGYPLSVFVVTDGNVWDSEKDFKALIAKHKDVKISTIGIDTNQAFIDNLAAWGKGTSQQINSNNQIKPAILSSLKQALVPALTDIKLEDYKPFDFVWPRDPFSVFSNEKIEISGVFKKGKLPKSIKLQFQNKKQETFIDRNLPIVERQIVHSSSIFVLEVKEYLKRCDKALAIKKSKEYQVESDYTSFAIDKYEKTDVIPEVKPAPAPKKKVSNARAIVPAIGVKRPYRHRPGKLAEREIKKYQNSTELLIPKTKLKNIVKTISNDAIPDMRFKKEAYQAFHEAAEAYIVDIFKASVNASANHKRMTVRPGDMQEAVIDVQQAGQNQPANPKQGRTRSGKVTPAVQAKPQPKRTAKRATPKRSTTPKKSSTKASTPESTPRTRSASKSADVVLQTKRGRGKQAKVISPQKKAKTEKIEAKPVEKKQKEATNSPAKKKAEVKCIDVGYEVEKIMHLQNTDGFWESSKNLSEIVNNLLDYDLDISKFNEKVATALVVALLDEKCKDYKCLWDLVVMKAKRWLAKNKQKLLKLSDF